MIASRDQVKMMVKVGRVDTVGTVIWNPSDDDAALDCKSYEYPPSPTTYLTLPTEAIPAIQKHQS